jgi:hypothetical protein
MKWVSALTFVFRHVLPFCIACGRPMKPRERDSDKSSADASIQELCKKHTVRYETRPAAALFAFVVAVTSGCVCVSAVHMALLFV